MSHVDILTLRGILEPKRKEVTGGWKNCIVKKNYELYSSSSIVRVIESRRRGRWAGHVARMVQREMPTGIRRGNLKYRDLLEDQP